MMEPIDETKGVYVIDDVVPLWVQGHYDRMYYSDIPDHPGKPGSHGWSQMSWKNGSQDITRGGAPMLDRRDTDLTMDMSQFCNYVSRLLPRTREDAEPLMNLKSGLINYLVKQMSEVRGTQRAQGGRLPCTDA